MIFVVISSFALSGASFLRQGPVEKPQLDAGKKWPGNKALQTNMLAINEHIQAKLDKISDNSMTDQEYRSLGSVIGLNINAIFKYCKLPKDADGQLHVIMVDLIRSKKILLGSLAKEEKKRAINNIMKSYKEYLIFSKL